MAINIGQPLCNTTDGYLCEGKDIKGGYFVIDDITKVSRRITEKGSLCYVTGTSSAPINKFYQYDGTDWQEANLGGGSSGGEVTVGSTIAGFTVGDKHLTSNVVKDSIDYSTAPGVYIGTDGILVGHYLAGQNYYPGVKIENSTGKLTANNVDITGGKIYNKHTYTSGTINLDYYMTAPDKFNLGNPLYMTDDKSEFSYVSTNGIGTMKFTSLDGVGNANCAVSNSYMSAGKLYSNNAEITGGTISGYTKFRNEYTLSNNSKLYMSSYNTLNRASISLGSTSLDDIRDYTYVGADGIGTYHINAMTGGNISSTSRTYMTAGQLVSNDVNITGGALSGFTLKATALYTGAKTSFTATGTQGIYIGTDGIAVGHVQVGGTGPFYGIQMNASTGELSASKVTITGGTINSCTIGGSTKVDIAHGGTGSTTAYGGAINLLKALSNVNYSASYSVTIPRASITNDGFRTTGSTSGTITGLILNVSTSTSYCTVSAKNDPSTGKATYTVKYSKDESQIQLPDTSGVSAIIQILSIPYD